MIFQSLEANFVSLGWFIRMISLLQLYVLQLDSKHDAANAYVDAANCYKKTSKKGALLANLSL